MPIYIRQVGIFSFKHFLDLFYSSYLDCRMLELHMSCLMIIMDQNMAFFLDLFKFQVLSKCPKMLFGYVIPLILEPSLNCICLYLFHVFSSLYVLRKLLLCISGQYMSTYYQTEERRRIKKIQNGTNLLVSLSFIGMPQQYQHIGPYHLLH